MMTDSRPEVDASRLYTQAQTARTLGVSRRTVARWTKAGNIVPDTGKGTESGRDYYSGKEIMRIWYGM